MTEQTLLYLITVEQISNLAYGASRTDAIKKRNNIKATVSGAIATQLLIRKVTPPLVRGWE